MFHNHGLELGAQVPSHKEALLRPIGRCQTFNATADGYVRTGDAADRVDLGGRLISEVHRLPLVIS